MTDTTNRVLIGTATNAAIRSAIADTLRRSDGTLPDTCPPRLRHLLEQLSQREAQEGTAG